MFVRVRYGWLVPVSFLSAKTLAIVQHALRWSDETILNVHLYNLWHSMLVKFFILQDTRLSPALPHFAILCQNFSEWFTEVLYDANSFTSERCTYNTNSCSRSVAFMFTHPSKDGRQKLLLIFIKRARNLLDE